MDKKTQDRLILMVPFLIVLITGPLIWLAPHVAQWIVIFLLLAPVLYVILVIAYLEHTKEKKTTQQPAPAQTPPPASSSTLAPADPHGLLCPHCGAQALSLLRKWTLWTENQHRPCRACGEPVFVEWWHRLRASMLPMFLLLGYATVTPLTDRGQHGIAVLGLAGVLFILLESFTVPLSRLAPWRATALKVRAAKAGRPARSHSADGGTASGHSPDTDTRGSTAADCSGSHSGWSWGGGDSGGGD